MTTKHTFAVMSVLLAALMGGCKNDSDGGGGGGSGSDRTAPTVISTFPAADALSVALNTNVIARFSEAMNGATITAANFTLTGPGVTVVSGTVSHDPVNHVADFLPSAALAPSTLFTATITVGVKDAQGNAMAAPYTWSFTTGTLADTTPPTVTDVTPLDLAIGVPINTQVTATFSEQMDSSTVDAVSFTLMDGMTPILGSVSCPGTTATFTPAADLPASTTLTARITTQVRDLADVPMASDYVWTFQTGVAPAAGPAPVVLGTAGGFVILAKSGVSTTGTTAVVGNVGLSPAARPYLTGFSETMDGSNVFSTSSYVAGRLYAADYTPPTPINLTTAVLDMQTAYTDAAGRSLPDFTELGAGNINGLTLVPGLYKWGTSVTFGTGISIAGGANDVWIFQIDQNLIVGNGALVTLTGGAKAENIFWQVAGQSVFGTNSNFKGIVLCQTAIILQNGAIFSGRVLAQTAVTLDAVAISEP